MGMMEASDRIRKYRLTAQSMRASYRFAVAVAAAAACGLKRAPRGMEAASLCEAARGATGRSSRSPQCCAGRLVIGLYLPAVAQAQRLGNTIA